MPTWTPALPKQGHLAPTTHKDPPLPHFWVHSLPGLFAVGIGDIHHCCLTLGVHWGSKTEVKVRAARSGDGTNDVNIVESSALMVTRSRRKYLNDEAFPL